MLLLDGLPEDIVHEILSYLEHDKLLLYSLYQVSRYFGAVLPQYLYRRIDVQVRVLDLDIPRTVLGLLLRSLSERPRLALHVRTLELSWDSANTELANYDMRPYANELLAKLKNLRSFTSRAIGSQSYKFEPTFIRSNPMLLLRSVTLCDNFMTLAELMKWMLLEHVELIALEGQTLCHARADTHQPSEVLEPRRKAADLSSLRLSNSFSLTEDVLQAILQMTPSLKHLACSIPRSPERARTEVFDVVFPAPLVKCLEPVRQTLISLVVSDSKVPYTRTGNNGSYLNLSHYPSLRRLQAPAACFFASTVADSSRNGVNKLLPPTLEELNIDFPYGWDFVYDAVWQWGDFVYNGFDVDEDKYAWVEEIALQIPSLKRLDITEHIDNERVHGFERFVWSEIPAKLKGTLSQAGVAAHFNLWQPRQSEGLTIGSL